MKFQIQQSPPDDAAGGGGGGEAAVAAPAAAPAPAAAASPAPAPAAAPPASAPATAPAPVVPPVDDSTKGYWPDDWRKNIAGADEKQLKRLERYQSPKALADALIAAQNKIASGELKPVLAKDAKPEELAEYRKAHGIPEAPEKYDLKGIDEADLGFASEIAKAAHATHQTPDQLAATMKTWKTIKDAAFAAQAEKDVTLAREAEDALRTEWGGEYRRNINLIAATLDTAGDQKIKDQILRGRLADGTPIGSSPAAMRVLLAVALKENPTGVVVPGGDANPQGTIQGELDKIETLMKSDRQAYNRDEKMQARYRDLLDAKIKLTSR